MKRAYQKFRRVPAKRLANILTWAMRLGFTDDQGAEWITGGWRRLYNLNHAEPLRDFTGKLAPRIYSAGAIGIQVEWRIENEGQVACVKVWRV